MHYVISASSTYTTPLKNQFHFPMCVMNISIFTMVEIGVPHQGRPTDERAKKSNFKYIKTLFTQHWRRACDMWELHHVYVVILTHTYKMSFALLLFCQPQIILFVVRASERADVICFIEQSKKARSLSFFLHKALISCVIVYRVKYSHVHIRLNIPIISMPLGAVACKISIVLLLLNYISI